MKKISNNKLKSKDNTYDFPPKTDFVFRIHMKTNSMGIQVVMCFEMPDGEQHIRNFGNVPSHSLLIPFSGQNFELYLDGEFIGIHNLLEARKDCFTYEKIE